MSADEIQKKKIGKGVKVSTFSYSFVDSATEAEIQLRLNKAFDVVFSEILKKSKLTTLDN